MTLIEDSPARAGGLITGQGTARQGAAAPHTVDTAPFLSSGVALQTTVAEGGGVIAIEDSPAIAGLITGQRTTRQAAAAPGVVNTAPLEISGVAAKECVGDDQLIGVVNTSAMKSRPVVTENAVRNRQLSRVVDAPACVPAYAIGNAIGNGKPVETDGVVVGDVEDSEGSRTPAHGEEGSSRPRKRNVVLNVGQRTRQGDGTADGGRDGEGDRCIRISPIYNGLAQAACAGIGGVGD